MATADENTRCVRTVMRKLSQLGARDEDKRHIRQEAAKHLLNTSSSAGVNDRKTLRHLLLLLISAEQWWMKTHIIVHFLENVL